MKVGDFLLADRNFRLYSELQAMFGIIIPNKHNIKNHEK